LLVTANIRSSPILVTQMMEARCSSETSLLTSATQRNIPEDYILHSHRLENLKPYNIGIVFCWTEWDYKIVTFQETDVYYP
jgi:hypothetical protein